MISEREQNFGLHFVCNSLFLVKAIETIVNAILDQRIGGNKRGIIEFLYEIEKSGKIEKEFKHFLNEYRVYF